VGGTIGKEGSGQKERQDETQFTTKIRGEKLVGVQQLFRFVNVFIASYAFDALLCWNWPFWPPPWSSSSCDFKDNSKSLRFKKIPMRKTKFQALIAAIAEKMELWGVVRPCNDAPTAAGCCWASFSTSHPPPSLLHLIICSCFALVVVVLLLLKVLRY
jgi:hypothetical protein